MAQAKKDQNHISTIIGVSSVDGVTPIPIAVDPITGYLLCDVTYAVQTSSPVLRSNAKMDNNNVASMLGWNGTTTQALITHNSYLIVAE